MVREVRKTNGKISIWGLLGPGLAFGVGRRVKQGWKKTEQGGNWGRGGWNGFVMRARDRSVLGWIWWQWLPHSRISWSESRWTYTSKFGRACPSRPFCTAEVYIWVREQKFPCPEVTSASVALCKMQW